MILVDSGIWYAMVVVLAISLCANIIQAGLVVRWRHTTDQYKGLWKDATARIIPCDPYRPLKDERSIQYEYLEGLD